MPPLSSYTSTLPADVLLDSGILYIGAQGSRTVFSAIEGGLKFDPGKAYREVMFSGKRSRIRGLDRNTEFKSKITGTIIECSAALMPSLEPGATAVTLSGSPAGFTSGYQAKRAGVLYVTGDYIATISAVWQRGDGTYVQVRFYDGAAITKWDIVGTDNQEGKIAIEIDAVLDLTVSGRIPADCPYVVEFYATAPS